MVQPTQHTHHQVVTETPEQPVQTQQPTGKMSKFIPKVAEKVARVAITLFHPDYGVLFNPEQRKVMVELLQRFNNRG